MSLVLLLVVTGCEVLKSKAIDPNSGLNKGVATVQQVGATVQVAGKVGETAGIPFAWILTEVGTGIVALTSIYKAWRKKVLLDETNNHLENVTATAQAIIQAVETVGNTVITPATVEKTAITIGSIIKTKVGENLVMKGILDIGKSLISSLKV